MIRWKPEFAIGVPELDDQHQALFEYAARLQHAVDAGHLDYRVEEILGYLTLHVGKHFETEERVMRESGYPGLDEHVEEHRQFERRLAAFTPDWKSEADHASLVVALIGLMDFWFAEHMTRRDWAIGEHVRGRPRGPSPR